MKAMLFTLALAGALSIAVPWAGAQTLPASRPALHSVSASTSFPIRPQPLPFCYYHPSAVICVMP
jgi:hypothetical protein